MKWVWHRLCDICFSLRIEVCIKICRDTEIGMPEPFLNILEGETLRYKQTCTRMSQIVKSDVRESVFFQYLWKLWGYIIRCIWFAVVPLEYIAVFYILFSKQSNIFLFSFFKHCQNVFHFFCQRIWTITWTRLCAVLFKNIIESNNSMFYRYCVVLKVYTIPF